MVNYTLSRAQGARKEELRKILKEMLNFDTILTASETVSLGFADEIFQKEIEK
jgi:ATP-dependent protease ClpP protease subunit